MSRVGISRVSSPDPPLILTASEAWGIHFRPLVESKTRTYHGRVGSGLRTTGQRGGAEPGRTGRRRIGSPRRQLTLAPPKASSTPVLNDSSEARTSEILCKPMEEQNPRLTSGSSAGREALLVPGCSLVDCRLFVSANPSHPKDVRELRTKDPKSNLQVHLYI